MSTWPIFKDFDKSQADLISDDFDAKYTLKIKSAGPFNTVITTTTTLKDGKNGFVLIPKLATKYTHSSGFTVDKFEVSDDAKATVETSLTGAAPGLKLEFKGNDSDKADLSFQYKIPAVTITGDVDIFNFNSTKLSVCGGNGDVTVGASAAVKLDKMAVQSTSFGVGLGYKLPNIFIGVRANNSFADYSALWSYDGFKGLQLAGEIKQDKDTNATVVGAWKCNPDTTLKFKVSTANSGTLYSSVKQQFPNKFAVVSSAEVPVSFNAVKFGLNATLG